MSGVAERLAAVRAELQEAAHEAGRDTIPTLVAVSKTVDIARIREAYAAGQRVFGENRVQEAQGKIDLAADMPEALWALIGHLQSNKAALAADLFHEIHSVDSVRLAHRLDRAAAHRGKRLRVLIEVNMAAEPTKAGLLPTDVEAAVREMMRCGHLELCGLMTVAPNAPEPEEVRPVFRAMRELGRRIRVSLGLETFEELSMGMSGDFRVAVSEGATMVRLGRAIFGDRPPAGEAAVR